MSTTSDTINAMLREAASTLRRLPSANIKPRMSYWPDVVRQAADLYLGEAHARNTAPRPSPAAIDRMDAVLVWLLPLSAEQRRIVWARACGVPWRKLEDMDGRSHMTLRKIHAAAISRIVVDLHHAV